jgi:hypothetical protein
VVGETFLSLFPTTSLLFTMKGSLTQLLGSCAVLLVSLASCNKDEVRAVAQPGAAPTLTASATTITLTQPNSENDAVKYTWTPTTFGYQAIITYTLQFDKKGGDFSSPVSFAAGSATTRTLTVGDLNSIYQSKGLVSATSAPTPTAIDARVVASVSSDAPTVASSVLGITATPYSFCAQPAKAWSIIGDAGNGWNPGNDIVMTYDCVNRTYSYTGPLKATVSGNPAGYKFRYNGAWDANLGGTTSTGGALTQGGSNLSVPADKTYTIVLTPGNIAADGTASGGSFTIK